MKFFSILLIFLFFTGASYCQVQKIDDLKKNLPQITDSVRYADALNRIGQLYFEKNVDSSFSYAIKARELSKKISYQKGIADATNTMGVLYDMKGDLQLSLKYYNDAYNTYKSLNEQIGVVQATMRIGLVYNENAEHKKSIAAFTKALNIGKTLEKDSIVALVLCNYMLLYPDKIASDTFSNYLSQARQIAAKYRDNRIITVTDQIAAQQIIRNGNVSGGIELLKKASAKATEMDLNYLNLDILISLGDMLIKTDFAQGISYYQHGLDISEEKGYRIYTKIIAKKLFDIYSAKHDIVNAERYSNKLVQVYQEEEKLNNASGVDYIDYALKDQELRLIGQSSEYRKNIITILSILFAAVLITGLVIYRLLRLKEKHSHTLEALNNIMRTKNEELEINHEFNNKLISILAHDFRQPIGIVKSLANLLKDDTLSPEELKQLVQSMEVSSNESLEIFENILEWIKKQLSGYMYEPKRLPLKLIIDESVHQFRPLIEKFNITIENNVDREMMIYADSELVQFVHRNFIHNAIKFSPEKSTITITALENENEIIVKVKDEGKGISSEKIQHLFNFKKELYYSNEKEKGAGVALMICKDFITKMSGKIWAENSPESGAIFVYSLPITQD